MIREIDVMTDAPGPPIPPSSVIDHSAWNRQIFEKLCGLIGQDVAADIARRFWSDLCGRFVEGAVREVVRRDAHAVTSTSGMLGLTALSQAARTLEAACEDGETFGAPLQAFMEAKLNAGKALGAIDRPDGAS